MKALCGRFQTCHALLALLPAKSLADSSKSAAKTKVVCSDWLGQLYGGEDFKYVCSSATWPPP